MDTSVLTLGEKIVRAARLAAIEHVRQELDAIRRGDSPAVVAKRVAGPVGDGAAGVTDDAETDTLSRPLPELLGEVLGRIAPAKPDAEAAETQVPARRRRRKGAA